jgi:hypothetical protein
MNTEYLSNAAPLDTTFPFGVSEAQRLTTLVVEGITHVKDLVVTGRANGVARVMTYEDPPVNAVSASVTLGEEANDDAFTISAIEPGTWGNSVNFIFMLEAIEDILFTRMNNTISVSVPGADSAFTSTAAEVMAAIEAEYPDEFACAAVGASDGSGVLSATPSGDNELAGGVDATAGQLGSCCYGTDLKYEVSSLDAYNNPVWQQVALEDLA